MGSGGSKPADVASYVERLCGGVDGCRVMVGEGRRVVVADAPSWTDDMSQCVKGRFPGSNLSVFQCSSSITGFSVVIELPGRAEGGALLGVSLLLLLVSGVCAMLVLWPPGGVDSP